MLITTSVVQDSLSVHHLECLTALVNLSCLALQPRAFTRLPASDWSGLSSLCQLKGLTKLVLMPAHEVGHIKACLETSYVVHKQTY